MAPSPGYSSLLKELLIFIHDASDDALQAAHGRVHAQHDQHEEEGDRPRMENEENCFEFTKTGFLAGLQQPEGRLQTQGQVPGPPQSQWSYLGSWPCTQGM